MAPTNEADKTNIYLVIGILALLIFILYPSWTLAVIYAVVVAVIIYARMSGPSEEDQPLKDLEAQNYGSVQDKELEIGGVEDEELAYVHVKGASRDQVQCEWAWAGKPGWHTTAARPRFDNGVWEIGPVQTDLATEIRITVNAKKQEILLSKAVANGSLKPPLVDENKVEERAEAEKKEKAEQELQDEENEAEHKDGEKALCDVCKKPTWNNEPGYCSEACEQQANKATKDGEKQVKPKTPLPENEVEDKDEENEAEHKDGEKALCDVCKKPTWNNEPGYCSEACEQQANKKEEAPVPAANP